MYLILMLASLVFAGCGRVPVLEVLLSAEAALDVGARGLCGGRGGGGAGLLFGAERGELLLFLREGERDAMGGCGRMRALARA
jgi:hypothetical protein